MHKYYKSTFTSRCILPYTGRGKPLKTLIRLRVSTCDLVRLNTPRLQPCLTAAVPLSLLRQEYYNYHALGIANIVFKPCITSLSAQALLCVWRRHGCSRVQRLQCPCPCFGKHTLTIIELLLLPLNMYYHYCYSYYSYCNSYSTPGLRRMDMGSSLPASSGASITSGCNHVTRCTATSRQFFCLSTLCFQTPRNSAYWRGAHLTALSRVPCLLARRAAR